MKIFVSFLALILGLGSPASAKWKVDSYGNIKDGRSSVIISNEDTYNCRMSITSTTFSFVGDDGNALSADNPCIVGIKDNATGKNVAAAFTAPVSFTFGAGSDTDGNLFGLFGTTSWPVSLPLFVGVVTDGTNNYFTLSRTPMKQTGSASTDVCQKNDQDCDGENDVMILTSGLTLSGWTGKNITQIGWIYGTWSSVGSAWTFTITDGVTAPRAGFNKNYEAVLFTFPVSQSGADTGVYFIVAATNYPAFTTSSYTYTIDRNAIVSIHISLVGDNGTDGSSAIGVGISVPYTFTKANTQSIVPVLLLTPGYTQYGFAGVGGQIGLNRNTSATATAQVLYSEFSNGNRNIILNARYSLITN